MSVGQVILLNCKGYLTNNQLAMDIGHDGVVHYTLYLDYYWSRGHIALLQGRRSSIVEHCQLAILTCHPVIESFETAPSVSVNFTSLVTCVRFRMEEPLTAYPMSITWASHIAASVLTGCSTLPNQLLIWSSSKLLGPTYTVKSVRRGHPWWTQKRFLYPGRISDSDRSFLQVTEVGESRVGGD